MADRRPPGVRHPLVTLTRARWLEMVRDPGVLFWVFGFPIVLAIVLGIAFRSQPPEKLRVTVLQSQLVEPWRSALDSDVLMLVPSTTIDDAARALRTARVDLWLVPTSSPGAAPTFELRYDPQRPESRAARLAVDTAVQKSLGRPDLISFTEQTHAESGARYIDFLIPGLIGMNLMGSSMWGIGYAVVDARKRKLLKRFAATPMVRSHFLASYVLSRLLFVLLELGALLGFAALAFDVTVRGSGALLLGVSMLGALSFAGLALLIAARPSSTEVASGWMNFAMMPMWLASGSFFSYERFPAFLLPVIKVLPLTALNDVLRAVMNDGAGVLDVAVLGPSAILVAWGGVCFAVALRTFKWL